MERRDLLSLISMGTAASLAPGVAASAAFQKPPERPRGLPPLKITDIQTILTAPDKIRLVVVKVLTSEPGPRARHPAGRDPDLQGAREAPAVLHRGSLPA